MKLSKKEAFKDFVRLKQKYDARMEGFESGVDAAMDALDEKDSLIGLLRDNIINCFDMMAKRDARIMRLEAALRVISGTCGGRAVEIAREALEEVGAG